MPDSATNRREEAPPRACPAASLAWLRSSHLRRSREYRAVYERGQRRPSAHFVLFALAAPPVAGRPPASRLGVTVSRQVGGAVVRNRIRRRIREMVRRHWPAIGAGWHLVINPRRSVLQADFAALEAEWLRVLRQLLAPARGSAIGESTK